MYRSIGLTCETSPQADKAATLAKALSSAFGAELRNLATDTGSVEQQRLHRLRSLLPEDVANRMPDVPSPGTERDAGPEGVKQLDGAPLTALDAELRGHAYDLLVTTALQGDERSP